ncbi:3'-5' exonuclease [Corynebacterium hadale]|nr:3'-5' exonuclease [Corynebacterium hadale]
MTGMASAPAAFDASRMLSFDLETTSVNPLEARIVTSALVRIDGREVTANETLADPGVEIPEAAAAVHGISTEKARAEGRDHDEVLRETVDTIKQGWEDGLTLIVFNAPYDLSVLRALTGDFTVTGPVFDPLLIDRARDRYRKGKRNLGALCEHYGVRLDNAHEATSDAMAAARIAWKQVRKVWPELAEMDTDELMEYQAVENYRIQTDLKKWLESRGRDASNVNMGWPMVG